LNLFGHDQFVAIFDEPDNTDHRIQRSTKVELNELHGFVGDSYFQERTNEAYRSKKDCRSETLTDADWDGFDYKLLVTMIDAMQSVLKCLMAVALMFI